VNKYYEKTGDNITTSYYLGSKLIAIKKGADLSYILQDHLSSTSGTVNTAGASTSTISYLPFGATRVSTGTVPTDMLFTGQRKVAADPLDGLYYYNARYYDAKIGRFISADTIVPNPANPQSLNRYSYCLNNPLKYVDPTGHYNWWGEFCGVVNGTGSMTDEQSGRGTEGNSAGRRIGDISNLSSTVIMRTPDPTVIMKTPDPTAILRTPYPGEFVEPGPTWSDDDHSVGIELTWALSQGANPTGIEGSLQVGTDGISKSTGLTTSIGPEVSVQFYWTNTPKGSPQSNTATTSGWSGGIGIVISHDVDSNHTSTWGIGFGFGFEMHTGQSQELWYW
jgi:RHS repeat-associated protein